jgi:hypothetical protein
MSSEPRRWSPVVIGEPVHEFEPRPPRTSTYRPDTAADGWSSAHFAVRAASVRGYQHRSDGSPRQDDFAVGWHAESGALVIAVADGVSSVELAHIGATLACRSAIDYLTRWLDSAPGDTEPDWLDLARCASWALVQFTAGQDADLAERQLATTLVVAVVRPRPDGSAVASFAQVGDSDVWLLHDGQWRKLPEVPSDDGLLTPAVSALPRVPVELPGARVELPQGAVLVLGSDGFGGPLGSGHGAVGRRFAELLAHPPATLELAHVLDFSRETFDDDRTIVAVWPRQP